MPALNDKNFEIKIFDKAGTSLLSTFNNVSRYNFTKTINGGLGELMITLPRKFDDFGEGEDIDFANEVQVWVQDLDSGNSGVKIYSGFITGYQPFVTGNSEGVNVRVLGYVARFGYEMYRDPEFDPHVVQTSADPADIARSIIDEYRTYTTDARIDYTVPSVVDAGFTVSYTYAQKNNVPAVEITRELAGADYFWFVDAENLFSFKPQPSTATHTFTFGKDISELSTKKEIDDIANFLSFWNGLQDTEPEQQRDIYRNTTSSGDYFRRWVPVNDASVKDQTTADKFGEAFITAKKDPNVGLSFTVKDNNYGTGYDIESINPGDTCKILNISPANVFSDNMLITRVDYSPEQAKIEVQDIRALTSRSLSDLRRSLNVQQSVDYPQGALTPIDV